MKNKKLNSEKKRENKINSRCSCVNNKAIIFIVIKWKQLIRYSSYNQFFFGSKSIQFFHL